MSYLGRERKGDDHDWKVDNSVEPGISNLKGDSGSWGDLPEQAKDNGNYYGQSLNAPMFGLLIDPEQAELEKSEPKDPFEECGEHDGTDDDGEGFLSGS